MTRQEKLRQLIAELRNLENALDQDYWAASSPVAESILVAVTHWRQSPSVTYHLNWCPELDELDILIDQCWSYIG